MDYNKLSQTAHAAALKNGWYEGEQVGINTMLALIKSEIYEAFDSFRDGKYSSEYVKTNYSDLVKAQKDWHISVFKTKFRDYIKDSFEDEIADTAIRICDFCGWYGIELGDIPYLKTWSKGAFASDLVAIDILITKMYNRSNEKLTMAKEFGRILGNLESIAQTYNFDLEQHINLKLAYNATRGHKHGNKVL